MHTGLLQNGKKHGDWVEDYGEGPYVGGKRHGHWVERGSYNDESSRNDWWLYEGDYVEGKRHRLWIIKKAYERKKKVNYLNGKRVK